MGAGESRYYSNEEAAAGEQVHHQHDCVSAHKAQQVLVASSSSGGSFDRPAGIASAASVDSLPSLLATNTTKGRTGTMSTAESNSLSSSVAAPHSPPRRAHVGGIGSAATSPLPSPVVSGSHRDEIDALDANCSGSGSGSAADGERDEEEEEGQQQQQQQQEEEEQPAPSSSLSTPLPPSRPPAVCWGWRFGSSLMASPAPAVTPAYGGGVDSACSLGSSIHSPDSVAAAELSGGGSGTHTGGPELSRDLAFPSWGQEGQEEQEQDQEARGQQPRYQPQQYAQQRYDNDEDDHDDDHHHEQQQEQITEQPPHQTSLVHSLCEAGEAVAQTCGGFIGAHDMADDVAELGTSAAAELGNFAEYSFDSLTAGINGMMAAGGGGGDDEHHHEHHEHHHHQQQHEQEEEERGDFYHSQHYSHYDEEQQQQQHHQLQQQQQIHGASFEQARDYYLDPTTPTGSDPSAYHQQQQQQPQPQHYYQHPQQHHMPQHIPVQHAMTERDRLIEEAARYEEAGDHTSALHCLERCLVVPPPPPTTASTDNLHVPSLSPTPDDHYHAVVDPTTASPDVADVLHKIGVLHWKNGSYDESLAVLTDALSIYRRTLRVSRSATYTVRDECTGLDTKHNDGADALAEILNSIGRVHFSRGEYGAAMRHYQESLAGQTSIYAAEGEYSAAQQKRQVLSSSGLEDESPATGGAGDEEETSVSSRSRAALSDGQIVPTSSARKSKKMKRRRAAIDHPGVARTTICIGMVHEARGNDARAMRYFQDGLRAQRAALGNESVDVAATLNSIGAVHEKWGDYERAMACYEEALWIYRTRLGNDSVDVAVALNNTGQVHHHWGQYDEAMAAYAEALRVTKMVLGKEHRNVASTLHNIALVHAAREQYDRALKIYRDVLKLQRAALGDAHLDVAVTLDSIASAYEGRGRHDKASKFYCKALRVRRDALGRKHLLVAMTLDRLGRFYLEREHDYGEAVRRLTEAREVYASNGLGEDDARVVDVVRSLEAATRMQYAVPPASEASVLAAGEGPLPGPYNG